MSTAFSPSIELPDGYTVSDRIGSGGYGEVWRATAPGGVEKAIKVVFGHCSEDLAERELKSLERIRAVRHPFVISLERFEIVNGRLIIVTELADMSLEECFSRHRQAGEPGIPREELLSYLADAAEALDCLVERHSLQHLDIKPENLLVVGDHVKVADFGLVKELATRTLNSMMGGMTPLYSAPEVFDDAPTKWSDQYSLAIVYQQMLTGKLPFPGRTPAQLAKQHTQAEPNLQPLTEADRRVVRRALAKKPEARFGSCRDFIKALRTGNASPEVAAPPAAHPSAPVATPGDDDTKSGSAFNTEPIPGRAPQPAAAEAASLATRALACHAEHPAPAAQPARVLEYPPVSCDVVDVAPPSADAIGAGPSIPTLYVAIGGMGIRTMTFVRERMGEASPERLTESDLAWLAIDTDRETLTETASMEVATALETANTLHIPLKRPKQYRDASQDLLRWVSRRWLYNIPRSLQTRGYRALGRIAAVDHAEPILHSLHARLHHLVTSDSQRQQVRIVLLAGTSGGTGSGTVVDLAQAARSLADECGVTAYVQAVLALPERTAGTADSLAISNTYSLLTELDHAQRFGNTGEHSPPGPASRFESPRPPFDNAYVLTIPSRTQGIQRLQAYCSIADYLTLEATTPAAPVLAASRQSSAEEQFALCTFSCTGIAQKDDPDDVVSRSSTSLLACGHRRQSLLFADDDSLATRLKQARPALGLFPRLTQSPYLVCEGSHIQPVSVAARMAESYPDIAEAAGRLHTRDDIAWRDLREV